MTGALRRHGRRLRRRWRDRNVRDWVTGPPDFIGVGAQRSGTTWWWRLLCDHPRIHDSAVKETHFFDRYYSRELNATGLGEYHRLFARPVGFLTGEVCPSYISCFWIPRLLHQAAPDARIIVMLRDPLRRYQSGLSHELDTLKKSVRRRRHTYVGALAARAALTRSLYGRQLQWLFEYFDRSQVLLMQYERCLQDPVRELQRTYSFVGAEPAHHTPSDSLIARRSRSSPPQIVLPEELSDAVRQEIRRDVEELTQFAPEIDLDLWPSCSNDLAALDDCRGQVRSPRDGSADASVLA